MSIFFLPEADPPSADIRLSGILFSGNLLRVCFEVMRRVPSERLGLGCINTRTQTVARPPRQHRYLLREHLRNLEDRVLTLAPKSEIISFAFFADLHQAFDDV